MGQDLPTLVLPGGGMLGVYEPRHPRPESMPERQRALERRARHSIIEGEAAMTRKNYQGPVRPLPRPRGPIHPKEERGAPPPELYGRRTGEHVRTVPASDFKELVRLLDGFTMDELDRIPIVVPGERLEQGSVYVDLTDDDRSELVAPGGRFAERGRYFVPKRDTPKPFWNRIVGGRRE